MTEYTEAITEPARTGEPAGILKILNHYPLRKSPGFGPALTFHGVGNKSGTFRDVHWFERSID